MRVTRLLFKASWNLGAVSLLVITGCATGPSPVQMMDQDTARWRASLPEPGADYGIYPQNYQEIVTTAIAGILKDPDSAKYSGFTQPRHDQVIHLEFQSDGKGGLVTDGSSPPVRTAIYGYAVCVAVNAKNSYGGYTGNQTYWLLIRDGQVIRTAQAGESLYIGHLATCG